MAETPKYRSKNIVSGLLPNHVNERRHCPSEVPSRSLLNCDELQVGCGRRRRCGGGTVLLPRGRDCHRGLAASGGLVLVPLEVPLQVGLLAKAVITKWALKRREHPTSSCSCKTPTICATPPCKASPCCGCSSRAAEGLTKWRMTARNICTCTAALRCASLGGESDLPIEEMPFRRTCTSSVLNVVKAQLGSEVGAAAEAAPLSAKAGGPGEEAAGAAVAAGGGGTGVEQPGAAPRHCVATAAGPTCDFAVRG